MDIDGNMNAEIQRVLGKLLGKALWTCRRAADMATFQFGSRTKKEDFFKRPVEVGEYALHIQCHWRIHRDSRVVVGSRDLYYPAEYKDGDDREDFDWGRQANRRDRLLDLLFEKGGRQFTVRKVEVGSAGGFRIEFSEKVFLEVFPDDSLPHEHWRLLTPAKNDKHFVVTGAGIAP